MRTRLHPCWLSACFALATLAATTGAHAADHLPDCRPDDQGRSACFQRFSEGLAAVLMPAAGQADGRWGYIDTQGRMVIKPGYDQVRPFTNGLAAALRKGKWGYIDSGGRWVIEPLYDQASSFGTEGTALVTRADELLRLDRSGQTQPVLPTRLRAVLHDPVDLAEQRWSVSLEPDEQLWDLKQGRVMRLPDGLRNLAPPQDGLIPAARKLPSGAEYWGLLNMQGGWALPPHQLQSTDRPIHDQGLVARHRQGGWQFVNLQGEVQHAGPLHEVHLVRPGSWVVAPVEGQLELWDARASRVMALPPGLGLYTPTPLGDSVVFESREHVALVAPGGRAWHWPTKGRRFHAAQNLLWLLRDDGDDTGAPSTSQDIIRPDGQSLLDAATLARLGNYRITPMEPENARFKQDGATPIALALLTPLDPTQPPAMLTHDGRIVSETGWLTIRPRHDSADPWVVQTREGLFGAIDGQGRWVVAPVWQGLDDFSHGLTMGRRADLADGLRHVLLNNRGEVLSSPPEVSQDCTRWMGAVLTCVDDRGLLLQQYLWHPLRQQRTDMVLISRFERLAHGLYRVQQGERWGVMDGQGTWRVPPRLTDRHELRLLDQDVALETIQDPGGRFSRRFRLISLQDGRSLTELHLREPEAMGEGRYRVHTEHDGTRLINAQGETMMKHPWPSGNEQVKGPWATVLMDDIWGVMDLQGQWRVPPRYHHITGPVGPRQGLSVRTHGGHDLLMDADGAPVEGEPTELDTQATPAPASQQPALRLEQRGQRQAFVDAEGRVAITAQVQCQQRILRNARGQQTWPPQVQRCPHEPTQGARP